MSRRKAQLPNPRPGEILFEEFLTPMSMSQTALARASGVPSTLSARTSLATARPED
jgi:plasmid maintenance system antidote protein VapI